MPFNTSQPPHRALRSVVAEKTKKLVIWVGSGFSAAAGLPTWPELKARLVHQLREQAAGFTTQDSDRMSAMANRAEAAANPWIAFQILQKNLGVSTYRSTVRDALRHAATATCPEIYAYAWQLQPAGVITLNLDRLVTKALGEIPQDSCPSSFRADTSRAISIL